MKRDLCFHLPSESGLAPCEEPKNHPLPHKYRPTYELLADLDQAIAERELAETANAVADAETWRSLFKALGMPEDSPTKWQWVLDKAENTREDLARVTKERDQAIEDSKTSASDCLRLFAERDWARRERDTARDERNILLKGDCVAACLRADDAETNLARVIRERDEARQEASVQREQATYLADLSSINAIRAYLAAAKAEVERLREAAAVALDFLAYNYDEESHWSECAQKSEDALDPPTDDCDCQVGLIVKLRAALAQNPKETGQPRVHTSEPSAASDRSAPGLQPMSAPTFEKVAWRVGRKVGRTLYIADRLVGLLDTPELAAAVVDAMNARFAPSTPAPDPREPPQLSPERVAELEVVAHRATCAYCRWVGPDRPMDAPTQPDEREHLATCSNNPHRERIRELERALRDARSALNRDRTGLAEALSAIRRTVAGYYWIRDGEWGSYSYEQQTQETLREEIGYALTAIERHAEHALHSSGKLADKAVRAADDVVPPSPDPREERIAELTKQKDGAYSERDRCVALIARMARMGGLRVGLSRHIGEPWDHDWRNIVFIDLPTGQVSWHFHDSEISLFAGLPKYDRGTVPTWDGHSTEEKYRRVDAAYPAPSPEKPAPKEEVTPEVADADRYVERTFAAPSKPIVSEERLENALRSAESITREAAMIGRAVSGGPPTAPSKPIMKGERCPNVFNEGTGCNGRNGHTGACRDDFSESVAPASPSQASTATGNTPTPTTAPAAATPSPAGGGDSTSGAFPSEKVATDADHAGSESRIRAMAFAYRMALEAQALADVSPTNGVGPDEFEREQRRQYAFRLRRLALDLDSEGLKAFFIPRADLSSAVARAVEAEREACAKIVDTECSDERCRFGSGPECAAARIRARSQPSEPEVKP